MEQHGKTMRREESGFTLIELIIYMALLGILMTMVFNSFVPVMQTNSRQGRITETKIETGMGLDLLRADLEHAGFGLPWEFPVGGVPIPYFEPAVPAAMKDAPNVPRPVISEDASASSMNGSDYLTIKAMNVVRNVSSQKWGWLGRDGAHVALVQSLGVDAFANEDRVIVIRTEVSPGENRQLILNGTASGNYFTRPISLNLEPFAPPATPNDPNGERYLLYGLVDKIDPRRPFNRTDYYINNADVPAHCAPGTGTLVKATLNQSDDKFSILPIVDCAADFQVVYYLDTNGDGGWDTKANASGLAGLTAQQIRTQVKSIRCYVLTHEGGVDRAYTHPNAKINVGEVDVDGVTLLAGRAFDLSLPANNIGPTWANYRWKVYSLAVTPRNLQ
ncbi:MAG: prepilin-type N-terminal cleavage/methylation domain-containing protein [Deltaproteobacteria bacterium]|nr:prepilin-type N-terminal cleavage/methylation domain-containing protein [Deltaproteobacteria bacterium]